MALKLNKKAKKAATQNAAEAPKLSKKAKIEMDKPFLSVLPGVNLLSSDVKEVVEQQRLTRLFTVLSVTAVGLVAAAWVLQAGMIAVAQSKLDDVTEQAADLSAQEAQLAPVQVFYEQVDANRFTIQTTMSKEVLTSHVLTSLNSVTPAGVNIATVTMDVNSEASTTSAAPADPLTAGAGACPSQDPYNTNTLSAGCVTVDGTAVSRTALGAWLDAIEAEDVFTVAFIPSTSADSTTGGISFSATIGLNGETVYENRYADPEFLKAGTH